MHKKALITGITGQDGSFLAELLLSKGYEVHGIVRRSSTFNTDRLDGIYQDPHEQQSRLRLYYGDVTDGTGLRRILEQVQPDEVYNLAAQSHVRVSFDEPEYTGDVVGMGSIRMLEAVRDHQTGMNRKVRYYYAASSEMFGAAPAPQNEDTPFYPRSPYAVSKVAGYWYTKNYREAYGIYACNGILFNHESERRGETFVTRKITRALTRIKLGLQDKLYLGNLEAKRDWGYAGDYVEAMWLMLQQSEPDDYVVATGETHSIREFLDLAADQLDMDWRRYVEIDSHYFRPTEVDVLLGDPTKAGLKLGWKPTILFPALVELMVRCDLELARQEATLRNAGHLIVQRGLAYA